MYSLNKTQALVMQIREMLNKRLEEPSLTASQQNMIKQITNIAGQIATRISDSEKKVSSKLKRAPTPQDRPAKWITQSRKIFSSDSRPGPATTR